MAEQFGLLALGTTSEDIRRAVALVSAYCHSEPELLEDVLAEADKGVTAALVEGASVALAMLAEAEGRPLSTVLRWWCRAAAQVAEATS
jgi:hypothetical protein